MAKTEAASSSCAILCLMLLSFPCGERSMLVNAHNIITRKILNPSPPVTWTTWCVANPTTDLRTLEKNLEFVCDKIGCEITRRGAFCFLPDTVANHASVAMNEYYRWSGAKPSDCDFNKTGLIALYDPSYDGCHFYESQSKPPKGTVERKDTWCVAKPGTPEKILQANIDYVCRESKACNVIQNQGPCFNPTTKINHASVLMNIYYKTPGNNYSCDFNNTGLLVMTSPSYGKCNYA